MKRQDRTPEVYYYEWSVSRWRASETRAQLDSAGRGIYREILDLCYVQGSIPKDRVVLAGQCGCLPEELERIWPTIARHFYQDRKLESRLRNKVSDVVRKNFFKHIGTQKVNGRKGGLVKSRNKNDIPSDGGSQDKLRQAETSEAESRQAETSEGSRPALVQPPQQYGDWPETARAIHEFFPACDLPFIERLAAACAQTHAGIENPKCEFSDALVAAAVKCVCEPNQRGAGLFTTTVPVCIRTWATEGIRSRASPKGHSKADRVIALAEKRMAEWGHL